MYKTIFIKFIDLNGEVQTTGLTLDWKTVQHRDVIDICPLQRDLLKGSGTLEQRSILR